MSEENALKNLRDVHSIQGENGNWNYNNYMVGYYNGLELALAISEDREPIYRTLPKKTIAKKLKEWIFFKFSKPIAIQQ